MLWGEVVVASGYFDPLHVGHLEYFRLARNYGDSLIVIVNNDKQNELKKGKSFMSEQDRVEIISSINLVDRTVLSIDKDLSVSNSLRAVYKSLDKMNLELSAFVNGGDRHVEEIPEALTCKEFNIRLIDSLGEKIRSSNGLLKRYFTI